MLIILHILHSALFVVFGLPLVYLAFLTIAALRVKTSAVHAEAARSRRFAIVVPAHNEEIAIQKTIRSLQSIAYPRALFEIIVVADNCTDRTAAIAQSEGATVWERTDAARRGKGYALRWCFDRITSDEANGFEGIVVIDADSVVSGNYLAMLNVAIEAGADVMQTSDLVEPCRGSWTSEALRLSFVLYNYIRPLGRKALGFSAGLRGNGMCFTRRALCEVPWQAYSKAEDLEFGLQMLVAGYRTHFVPEAVALATMPQQAANAESQRARWEGGRLPVIRHYAGMLLRSAVNTRSFAAIDAFIDLATPAFVNMMAVSMLFGIASAAVWALAPGEHGAGIFACAWLAALSGGFVHVAGGLKAANDPSLYTTLGAVPKYIVWKVLLYLKLVRRKSSDEWVRTTREASAGVHHITGSTTPTPPQQE
jgi:1,2-diacylglycerol 3-beta-glucosyltransferase